VKLGVISSSWPSVLRPWAGHFVADLSAALARAGHEVAAVVPEFGAGGALATTAGVRLCAARISGVPASPARDRRAGLAMLRALRSRAAGERADLWLCHWWPTALAAPQGAPRLAVLHGSDVDLLERLPRSLARALVGRGTVVAVAESLAERFGRATCRPAPAVCRLGAQRWTEASERDGRWGALAADWLRAPGPRVLTVARDTPGKGLGTVGAARALAPTLSWLVVTPELGAGPREVEALVAQADLVVVPSERGPGLPTEGSPHIIAQAVAAGVPVLAGPNLAARDAARRLGQAEVTEDGAVPLASAVVAALSREAHAALRAEAQRHATTLGWDAVLPAWLQAIEQARAR
jgi:glycosyltransferase involved in cell wall biosynthesis